jgi:hypothetical protein|tara:strand:+ start:2457 stop:3140 length:684 start_codon:yes stop_codon:yes gene_type:complete
MAEDQAHEEEGIFNSQPTEKGSPTVSNTEENYSDQQKIESEGVSKDEENKGQLSLDEDKEAERERKRAEQVNSFFKKIVSGKMSINDLPRHQQWLRPMIEERLVEQAEKEKVSKELDLDALVEAKLAEKEDERDFVNLKATLNSMRLTEKQTAEIEAEFRDLRKLGVPRTKSLQKAMQLAGVKDENPRYQNMAIPHAGGAVSTNDSGDWRKNLNREERLKKLRSLTE